MTTFPRVVVYLQTQQSLDQLPACFPGLSAITLSAFHFGYNPDGSPYIHLNNNDPGSGPNAAIWPLMAQARRAGVNVVAMVGGAGGAYGRLFAAYDTFYPMWRAMLTDYHLDGVDLDVEEQVAQDDIARFIADLRRDLPSLLITAAPVASALQGGTDPLSGIDWRPLAPSLDWFNVQFYSGFGTLSGPDDYERIIQAGFPPKQILGGALTNDGDGGGYVAIPQVCATLAELQAKYGGQMGGTMGWEYFNALNVRETVDPPGWVNAMRKAVTP